MPIVADSGPILSFARATRLDILKAVVGKLIIPEAVWDDLVVKGAGRPAARLLAQADWISRQSVIDFACVEDLPKKLHRGEREAICLAKELGAALLVDEREARKEAERLGIHYFGSLRVLKEARDRGIIKKVRPILDQIISSGAYISETLYHDFLRELGEEE